MAIEKTNYPLDLPAYLKIDVSKPKEYFKKIVASIKDEYGDGPVSLLDIGCANGSFLHYVQQHITLIDSMGTDISEAYLEIARQNVPGVKFVCDSIVNPKQVFNKKFDICTCFGTMVIFDDLEPSLGNIFALTKPGGSIYFYDFVNPYGIDVLMRYRTVKKNGDPSEWKSAYNIRCEGTYRRAVSKYNVSSIEFLPFEMPFPIKKTDDPLRTWTIKTEEKEHQIVSGTGQLLNFNIIKIKK